MICVTQSALLLVETPDSLRFPARFRVVASATLASTHRAKSTGEIRRAARCNGAQAVTNDVGET